MRPSVRSITRTLERIFLGIGGLLVRMIVTPSMIPAIAGRTTLSIPAPGVWIGFGWGREAQRSGLLPVLPPGDPVGQLRHVPTLQAHWRRYYWPTVQVGGELREFGRDVRRATGRGRPTGRSWATRNSSPRLPLIGEVLGDPGVVHPPRQVEEVRLRSVGVAWVGVEVETIARACAPGGR
jgi:hypothetical protein